jgi:hypothetical protein
MLTEKCKLYFELFASKDLENISSLFSAKIVLRDWESLSVGKKEVLDACKNLFLKNDRIKIRLLNQSVGRDDRVYNEIIIQLDKNEILRVVDVVQFDSDGLIDGINAYKG